MNNIQELAVYLLPFWTINTGLNLLGFSKKQFKKLADIDYPVDFRISLPDGQRILGESTTWLGIPISLTIGLLSQAIFNNPPAGIITAIAVYCGHALGSFIKRRFKFTDGRFMPLIDHGDYVILGAIIFSSSGMIKIEIALASIAITLIMQPLFCYLGYKLGLREYPL